MSEHCGWCNKGFKDSHFGYRVPGTPVDAHDDWCQAPEVSPAKYLKLTLNPYQLVNLKHLLDVVCRFGPANTGDWAGEIPNMLESDAAKEVLEGQRPNVDDEELRGRFAAFDWGKK